mgnify:CR=1 FL=1
MDEKHQGGCFCGKLRYEPVGNPVRTAVCHCRYCQLRTGTAFGISVYFNTDQVTFTRVAGSSATLSKSGTGASATSFSGEKNTQKVIDSLGNEISTFSGGTIGGLISAKAGVVTPLVANLNTLANTFVTRVNSQH